ncbi:MAG: hypothetical protein F6J98_38515, partial [Moorea sp. SIO4G2]|nr:hypothetical protein [Moorena sp. SIO4G2]
ANANILTFPKPIEDILAEFDCTFVRSPLARLRRSHIDLPRQPFTAAIEPLLHQIQRNRKGIDNRYTKLSKP